MSNDKFTAAEQIRLLANQYQAMVAAADILEQLGSLEQATSEAQAARAAAAADRDAAMAQLTQAQSELGALQERANEMQLEAESKVADILAQAKRDAAAILDQAKQDADARVAHSQAKVDDMQAIAAESLKAKAALVDEADAKLASLTAATSDAQKQLDTVQAKLESVRAQINALAGGVQ